MPDHTFSPGFRLSKLDVLILIVGLIASVALSPSLPIVSLAIAVVVGHFFLFCNVFRVARWPEFIWAGVFLLVMADVILWQRLSISLAVAVVLFTTLLVVGLEMRKPSYHGIFWQRLNPGLPQWWAERHEQ
jgi:hypothetical protein